MSADGFGIICDPANMMMLFLLYVCSMEFCSGDLMEQIKALVDRHPDKLTVG